MDRKNRIFKGR